MHAQLGVLDQTRLDVVSARNDSEQAGIGWCLVIGILDQHSHFATDALQAHRHRQSQEIIRCTRRRLMLHLQIKRPGKQLDQAASRERDVPTPTMSRSSHEATRLRLAPEPFPRSRPKIARCMATGYPIRIIAATLGTPAQLSANSM